MIEAFAVLKLLLDEVGLTGSEVLEDRVIEFSLTLLELVVLEMSGRVEVIQGFGRRCRVLIIVSVIYILRIGRD